MAFWIFYTFIPLLRFSTFPQVSFDNSYLPLKATYEAGRIIPIPFISRACGYVTLHGKRTLQVRLRLRTLRWEEYPRLSWWANVNKKP